MYLFRSHILEKPYNMMGEGRSWKPIAWIHVAALPLILGL